MKSIANYKLLALKFSLKLLNNFIDFPESIKRLNFKINFTNPRYKPIFTNSVFKKTTSLYLLLYFDVSHRQHK